MMLVANPSDVSGAESRTPLAVLGVYHLLERVGAGGLGEVFRARDTVHGRTVAIKRVPAGVATDATRARALRATAEKLAALSHPGVALLYECGEEQGELFLVQEFTPGQTLAQLLGGRPLHARRAVDIALEAAEGLNALHAAGLVHGDLRPDNMMVTPKGHVKLLDAGLARFTGGGALRATACARLGSLPLDSLGAVRYLAPEEALGEGAGAQSDLFSLGAILYEMLAGSPAFERRSADETLLAVLQASPPRPAAAPAAIPEGLDTIVNRALSKSLDRRYPTAARFADDLRAIKTAFDAELVTTSAADISGVADARGRRWWLWAVLGSGLAGAGWWAASLVR